VLSFVTPGDTTLGPVELEPHESRDGAVICREGERD
jgi:hypothetical protein